MIKTLQEKIRISVALVIVFFCIYGVAFGIINRIVGGTIFYGFRIKSSDLTVDSVLFYDSTGGGFEMRFAEGSDSPDTIYMWVVESELTLSDMGGAVTDGQVPNTISIDEADDVDTTGTKINTALANRVDHGSDETITGHKQFTDTLCAGHDGADGLIRMYSDEGGGDQIIIFKPPTNMTENTAYTWPVALGDAGQFLQTTAAGVLSWATPSGSGDMLKSTYDTEPDDDIDQAAGGLGDDISAWTGLLATVSGTAAEIDDKSELEGQLTDVSDFAEADGDVYSNTHDFSSATISLPSNAVNAEGEIAADMINEGHLKAVNTAVDEDILTYESTTGDYQWHTPAELSLLSEYDQFWGGAELAIKIGMHSEIDIFYPMSNDTNSYFVRHDHDGSTANIRDTVTCAGKLPLGVDGNGVDSVTYNMRTTGASSASGLMVKVWKRDANELGALALCDSVAIAATTADAWEHKTTGALDVASADAGDIIEVWFVVEIDAGEVIDHDKPIIWYTGK